MLGNGRRGGKLEVGEVGGGLALWSALSVVATCPVACGRPLYGSRPAGCLQISTIRQRVICVVDLTIQTSANFPATFWFPHGRLGSAQRLVSIVSEWNTESVSAPGWSRHWF